MDKINMLDWQRLVLQKKFARKKRTSVLKLLVFLVVFFSLLGIKIANANKVIQADILSLHTAAGAVSYSNRLDDRKEL